MRLLYATYNNLHTDPWCGLKTNRSRKQNTKSPQRVALNHTMASVEMSLDPETETFQRNRTKVMGNRRQAESEPFHRTRHHPTPNLVGRPPPFPLCAGGRKLVKRPRTWTPTTTSGTESNGTERTLPNCLPLVLRVTIPTKLHGNGSEHEWIRDCSHRQIVGHPTTLSSAKRNRTLKAWWITEAKHRMRDTIPHPTHPWLRVKGWATARIPGWREQTTDRHRLRNPRSGVLYDKNANAKPATDRVKSQRAMGSESPTTGTKLFLSLSRLWVKRRRTCGSLVISDSQRAPSWYRPRARTY